MTLEDLANLIFPNIKKDIKYYESIYPKRELKEGAIVTRYAPSPTGFIHIGALYASFIAYLFAKQSDGIFYLRIEDTDTKRTIINGTEKILESLKDFGISFDEGVISLKDEKGIYGPYIQSERKEIYQSFIKELIIRKMAYPCFCSNEDLKSLRDYQVNNKKRIGYYGEYAKCRNLTIEEMMKKISNGDNYVIRFKSFGDYNKKIELLDEIRGKITMPENDLDIIIMKSDKLPTYHFAHLVDDYLMHTTHVIRGDEWLSSLPIHLQLFDTFGFKRPKYAHISPLLKKENNSIRKLSKRKDPECSVDYYYKMGIPKEAIKEYLATIINSNYESWHTANYTNKIEDYNFKFKEMSKSGALFDLQKLLNISKNYISSLNAESLYKILKEYLQKNNKSFYKIFTKDEKYSIKVLNIERKISKPRKDISCYSEIASIYDYMYLELFTKIKVYPWQKINEKNKISDIINKYIDCYYDYKDSDEIWLKKIKLLANDFGYAEEMKYYKEDPSKYLGHIGDITMLLRIILTKRTMTPNLYEIMQALGEEEVISRFRKVIVK